MSTAPEPEVELEFETRVFAERAIALEQASADAWMVTTDILWALIKEDAPRPSPPLTREQKAQRILGLSREADVYSDVCRAGRGARLSITRGRPDALRRLVAMVVLVRGSCILFEYAGDVRVASEALWDQLLDEVPHPVLTLHLDAIMVDGHALAGATPSPPATLDSDPGEASEPEPASPPRCASEPPLVRDADAP
jgi:hypothetical protein